MTLTFFVNDEDIVETLIYKIQNNETIKNIRYCDNLNSLIYVAKSETMLSEIYYYYSVSDYKYYKLVKRKTDFRFDKESLRLLAKIKKRYKKLYKQKNYKNVNEFVSSYVINYDYDIVKYNNKEFVALDMKRAYFNIFCELFIELKKDMKKLAKKLFYLNVELQYKHILQILVGMITKNDFTLQFSKRFNERIFIVRNEYGLFDYIRKLTLERCKQYAKENNINYFAIYVDSIYIAKDDALKDYENKQFRYKKDRYLLEIDRDYVKFYKLHNDVKNMFIFERLDKFNHVYKLLESLTKKFN